MTKQRSETDGVLWFNAAAMGVMIRFLIDTICIDIRPNDSTQGDISFFETIRFDTTKAILIRYSDTIRIKKRLLTKNGFTVKHFLFKGNSR